MDPTGFTESDMARMELEELRATCESLGLIVLNEVDTEQGQIAHDLLNYGSTLLQSRETGQESGQPNMEDPEQPKPSVASEISTMEQEQQHAPQERPLKDIHASRWGR